MSFLDRVLGPKVPREEMQAHQARYWTPKVLFTVAALMLVVSVVFPYWSMHLTSPQYPGDESLHVHAYVNRLVGDVGELEEVNHYIGMKSFASGATFERSVSLIGIIALGGLLLTGLFIQSRWVLVFALPAVAFPFVFLADLQYWLWRYGHELDPAASFSSSVTGFTPWVLGNFEIAQFDVSAWPGPGLYLALLAAVLTAVGLWFHRKAYKPLVDEIRARQESAGPQDGVGTATA